MPHQDGQEISQRNLYVYLEDSMLYKDQITASCDVWIMTNSVASAAAIVGCNRCHTSRHRIKEALGLSLGYSIPCGFHIFPKLIWCSSGWCIPGQLLCTHGLHVFD
ncbi:hypothetical protein TNCV_207571 [Trichonephila clavipes]|nr:hypothetical protein TNCV_207571 [Trichonephila clavipes]